MRRNNLFSILVLFALLSASISFGATINWTNTLGGDWSNAANWDPNQVPGAADIAQITNSGTYTVTTSSNASVNVLTLGGAVGRQTLVLSGGNFILGSISTGNAQGVFNITGGTLGGTGGLILAGPLNWSGGTITNLVQFNGGTFTNFLSGLNGGQIVNTGTLKWAAGNFYVGNGSVISNAPSGIINVTTTGGELSFGGTHTFNNAGHLNIITNATNDITDIFNNTGTVTINSNGALYLSGGGTESGPFTVAAGATNEFSGGTFEVTGGASISGAGTWINAGAAATFDSTSTLTTPIVNISGGTVLFNGTLNPTLLNISGGTVLFNNSGSLNPALVNLSGGILSGTNPVIVSGPFNWTGGDIVSNLVQFDGGTFSNGLSANRGQIVNTGILNWISAEVNAGNGSIISNASTGTINLTTDPYLSLLNGSNFFYNAGHLNVAVSGQTSFAGSFDNTGTVTINTGRLYLSGTHNLAGGKLVFGVSAQYNYGSNTLVGVADLAGTLELAFNDGYLPSVGNTYNILFYDSSSGHFTASNLPTQVVWQVSQQATNLSLTVLKLVPQVSWPTPADIVYGTTLGSSQLNGVATWNNTNVPGVFNYIAPPGTVLESGSNQTVSVAFVPNDPSTFASVTNTVLINVQKAPLTVTATSIIKNYGQTIIFAGNELSTFGLVNGDSVTNATFASTGAASTATVAASPYPITITNALGNGLTNYVITYAIGQLTVNPALLTITADNTNKIVGESLTFAGTEFTAVGLQNSETVGRVTLTSAGAPAGAAVGSYPIIPSAPTGGTFSPSNYTNNFVNGTLNVLAPSLAITADGTQYVLTFQALPGLRYQLQTKTDLTTSAWTALGDPISNVNGTVYVFGTISVSQTFFRLQIQLFP